ncbi:LLM class flavin-dependent oxidoreductase [Saccharibacillus sp. CPCC 101409]|uniref:LLM class flavin-dependent oxidoreductase n=1 Tax=Saccharibacillus sp. CPCC 101409 TaxID=3058041 RepID=UPI0026724086|nr:LLM class flavin-dependent oxidoreductase [Saccharibacillus sp. CPCC 101409]MDO3409942.1 LLM class flavin-dependent oxidoreductase [Saccharibacillus sp. CPCC 101409]
MRLSILDYSEIRAGGSPETALAESVRLAQAAERWGYTRYWVSEHHGNRVLAGSAPEILVSALAAATGGRMRVGSGGVMLPMHSPFKVAESFSVLSALYPGRIDLGVGRSTGGAAPASKALLDGRSGSFRLYPRQAERLAAYIRGTGDVRALPAPADGPALWLLGSSEDGAGIAAANGMGLAYGHFVRGRTGREAVRAYRERFAPARPGDRPAVIVSLFAVCGRDEAQAEKLARVFDDYLLDIAEDRKLDRVPTIGEAESRSYTERRLEAIAAGRARMVVGDPASVRRQLIRLADLYEADELMLATVSPDFELKLEMYRLLAEAFRLPGLASGDPAAGT